ncbi:hypothetical protein CES85_4060 [Ochrobactrum quorumnocens]|uniref:Uncharacterized protein n=1 Tax=Ochrobactrum quorumnocens TaxID=271865 RepID=A0A248UA51_9HYPH|nr:hypothetical protein CES85_4060 [[Ochrobactrum] quorumnocens]
MSAKELGTSFCSGNDARTMFSNSHFRQKTVIIFESAAVT